MCLPVSPCGILREHAKWQVLVSAVGYVCVCVWPTGGWLRHAHKVFDQMPLRVGMPVNV